MDPHAIETLARAAIDEHLSAEIERFLRSLHYQSHYEDYVREAAESIRDRLGGLKPQFAIVLGSGLGELARGIEHARRIDYADIPHFPRPTVEGHAGVLVAGEIFGVPILGFQGRTHYYEGADLPLNEGMLRATFSVHVAAELGIPNYFSTNAAGGLNPAYKTGDMMIIKNHILNPNIPNPLLGRQHQLLRVDSTALRRFEPMHDAYDSHLMDTLWTAGKVTALHAGNPRNEHVHAGTLMAVSGPTYESPAEAAYYRDACHADAVGMSTVYETIVARNRGMDVVGFSCITNCIKQDGTNATNHEEVDRVLKDPTTQRRFADILREFFTVYRHLHLGSADRP